MSCLIQVQRLQQLARMELWRRGHRRTPCRCGGSVALFHRWWFCENHFLGTNCEEDSPKSNCFAKTNSENEFQPNSPKTNCLQHIPPSYKIWLAAPLYSWFCQIFTEIISWQARFSVQICECAPIWISPIPRLKFRVFTIIKHGL